MSKKDEKTIKKELDKVIQDHKTVLNALKSEQDAIFVQEQLAEHFKGK
ncbi:MAG: hypothetical protein KA052_00555 [Candidatus Pacebacteria bacterium]|nr:hypothetical protein [Candidatus Paceibacterota bacterium]